MRAAVSRLAGLSRAKFLPAVLFSISIIFMLGAASARAQQTQSAPATDATPRGVITGRVTERLSGQPVVDGRITIEGQSAEANTDEEELSVPTRGVQASKGVKSRR